MYNGSVTVARMVEARWESLQWDERDLAVNHLRRPHQGPGGVLARAGILA
jgi:hypothetical protein